MRLTSAQTDRACGVLLAAACGDALGAGYEFGTAPLDGAPRMIGGGLGGFAPGEWTDDTAQAAAIAEVAATGADLRSEEALTAVAQRFADWYAGGPSDVGIQTSAVLALAGRNPTGAQMREAAYAVHERTGRSAGNGSLMRTGVVALAHLDDPAALVEASMAVSALTHYQDLAQQGSALWCLMIRHAVLHGQLPTADDVLAHLPNRDHWAGVLSEAEAKPPGTFTQNAWVVGALQAAWSAIVHTPVPDERPDESSFACLHLQRALENAVRIGHDTDTVAAIAGQLLGARWGASAVPAGWREVLHGWPGLRGSDLVDLALLTVRGGTVDKQGWPGTDRIDYTGWEGVDTLVAHPHDSGVLLGGAHAVDRVGDDVGAVVSLCRLGTDQVPERLRRQHHAFRLMDTVAEDNPNLAFVIDDAARTVARLRDQGLTVLLHCVAAQSRTPSVAARYSGLRGVPLDDALPAILAALTHSGPRSFLVEALRRLDGS